MLALFLTVLGARLWLVRSYSTALPFWDQWDAEGASIIKPWLEGHLGLSAFFAPHNEHRIVLTRLIALALFVLNGQWDAQLEMAFNALLCAGIAVMIAIALWRIFPARQHLAILISLGLFFSHPFAWENTLAGFQSQFYFLLIFSLVALWGLCVCDPLSSGWWMGICGLFLACLSMSSGFLVGAAVIGLYTLRFITYREHPSGRELLGGMICLAIVVIGLCTRVTVPGHASLKSESIGLFFISLGKDLAWPSVSVPWLALLMQMPLLLLCFRYLSKAEEFQRGKTRRCAELLLAAGLWVGCQAIAIAWLRGGNGFGPTSRYQDVLALGALINFLCLALWLPWPARHAPRSWPRPLFGLIWSFSLGWGLLQLMAQNLASDIPARGRSLLAQEENVRGYLATGDFDRYLGHKPLEDIPYPDAAVLRSYLDDPTLRRVLPANVQPPLRVAPITSLTSEDAFIPNGFPTGWDPPPRQPAWGSFTALGKASKGTWVGQLLEPGSLPYLNFYVAGELGTKGLTLGGRKAGSPRTKFPPPKIDRSEFVAWRSISLLRPADGPLEIVASDRNRGRWFAFTAPTEMGRWSHWTQWLLAWGKDIFALGVCSLFALGLVSGIARKSEPLPDEVAP